jgi:hypothetical protein
MKTLIQYIVIGFLVVLSALILVGPARGIGGTMNQTEVLLQDTDTRPFQFFLMREDQTGITLTAPVTSGDKVVNVSSGHGFTGTGEYMVIQENDVVTQSEVVSVSVNAITLNEPVLASYTTAAAVCRGTIDMNVDGSVTPQEFFFLSRLSTVPIDIQSVRLSIQDNTAGDDSTFGALPALTNGILVTKGNGNPRGLGTYRQHQDFRDFGALIEYTDKAGGGNFATNIAFSIKEAFGVVIRFDPRDADQFTVVVQDNLTGLVRLRISILGQYTAGE